MVKNLEGPVVKLEFSKNATQIVLLFDLKSDNPQYNTVGQWVDGTIVPPSDGPMFILIDWE